MLFKPIFHTGEARLIRFAGNPEAQERRAQPQPDAVDALQQRADNVMGRYQRLMKELEGREKQFPGAAKKFNETMNRHLEMQQAKVASMIALGGKLQSGREAIGAIILGMEKKMAELEQHAGMAHDQERRPDPAVRAPAEAPALDQPKSNNAQIIHSMWQEIWQGGQPQTPDQAKEIVKSIILKLDIQQAALNVRIEPPQQMMHLAPPLRHIQALKDRREQWMDAVNNPTPDLTEKFLNTLKKELIPWINGEIRAWEKREKPLMDEMAALKGKWEAINAIKENMDRIDSFLAKHEGGNAGAFHIKTLYQDAVLLAFQDAESRNAFGNIGTPKADNTVLITVRDIAALDNPQQPPPPAQVPNGAPRGMPMPAAKGIEENPNKLAQDREALRTSSHAIRTALSDPAKIPTAGEMKPLLENLNHDLEAYLRNVPAIEDRLKTKEQVDNYLKDMNGLLKKQPFTLAIEGKTISIVPDPAVREALRTSADAIRQAMQGGKKVEAGPLVDRLNADFARYLQSGDETTATDQAAGFLKQIQAFNNPPFTLAFAGKKFSVVPKQEAQPAQNDVPAGPDDAVVGLDAPAEKRPEPEAKVMPIAPPFSFGKLFEKHREKNDNGEEREVWRYKSKDALQSELKTLRELAKAVQAEEKDAASAAVIETAIDDIENGKRPDWQTMEVLMGGMSEKDRMDTMRELALQETSQKIELIEGRERGTIAELEKTRASEGFHRWFGALTRWYGQMDPYEMDIQNSRMELGRQKYYRTLLEEARTEQNPEKQAELLNAVRRLVHIREVGKNYSGFSDTGPSGEMVNSNREHWKVYEEAIRKTAEAVTDVGLTAATLGSGAVANLARKGAVVVGEQVAREVAKQSVKQAAKEMAKQGTAGGAGFMGTREGILSSSDVLSGDKTALQAVKDVTYATGEGAATGAVLAPTAGLGIPFIAKKFKSLWRGLRGSPPPAASVSVPKPSVAESPAATVRESASVPRQAPSTEVAIDQLPDLVANGKMTADEARKRLNESVFKGSTDFSATTAEQRRIVDDLGGQIARADDNRTLTQTMGDLDAFFTKTKTEPRGPASVPAKSPVKGSADAAPLSEQQLQEISQDLRSGGNATAPVPEAVPSSKPPPLSGVGEKPPPLSSAAQPARGPRPFPSSGDRWGGITLRFNHKPPESLAEFMGKVRGGARTVESAEKHLRASLDLAKKTRPDIIPDMEQALVEVRAIADWQNTQRGLGIRVDRGSQGVRAPHTAPHEGGVAAGVPAQPRARAAAEGASPPSLPASIPSGPPPLPGASGQRGLNPLPAGERARLEAARNQLRSQLREPIREFEFGPANKPITRSAETQREFLEYSLKDVDIQLNPDISRIEQARQRIEALEAFVKKAPQDPAFDRKLDHLRVQYAAARAAESHIPSQPVLPSAPPLSSSRKDVGVVRVSDGTFMTPEEYARQYGKKTTKVPGKMQSAPSSLPPEPIPPDRVHIDSNPTREIDVRAIRKAAGRVERGAPIAVPTLPEAEFYRGKGLPVWRQGIEEYNTALFRQYEEIVRKFPQDARELSNLKPGLLISHALDHTFQFKMSRFSDACRDALKNFADIFRARDRIRNLAERELEPHVRRMTFNANGTSWRYEKHYPQTRGGNPLGDVEFRSPDGKSLMLSSEEIYDLLRKKGV